MASVTLIPNGYTNTGSYNFTLSTNTSRQISNAYHNADNTSSSARLQLASNRSATRTSTMYLEFNKSALDDIPSSATINSVTANVRYYVSSTTYVSAVSLQLHADTSTKGSAVTNRPTTSTKYSITAGSWTLNELKNARLYVSATHNASTNTGYLYLYGADITVNYTLPVSRTITASSTATGVTVTPASQSVYSGESATVEIRGASSTSDIRVTDNNTDVTSQLVQKAEPGYSYSVADASGASYGFALNSNDYYESQNKGVDKSAAVCVVSFHLEAAGTVTFSYINYAEATYDFGIFGNIDVPLNNDYKPASGSMPDSDYRKACNTSADNSSSVQTLTYSMTAGDHEIYVKYSKDDATSSNNDTLQFKVAVTITGSYTPVVYYEYTISNVQANHTILVVSTSTGLPIRVKSNGTWVVAKKLFVKQNGSWVQSTTIKVKQNGTWH